MERVMELLQQLPDLTAMGDFERRAVETLVIILVLVLIRAVAAALVRRNTKRPRTRYFWSKGITYIVVFAGLLLVGRVWFEGVRSLATFLGLLSAGLALALRDPIVNLAGWIFILWRRPFIVGDRIQVASHAGDVVDVRVFQFTMLEIGNWVNADQSTGRLIHVPNGRVFVDPVANYTRGFPYIWNELPVMVTFESDWQAAKQILLDIANKHGASATAEAERDVRSANRYYLIHYSTLTPTVYTSVADSGVVLTIRYLCGVRSRRSSAERIWEEILRAFHACDDIDFAYPTRRLFDHAMEGKTALRPPEADARVP